MVVYRATFFLVTISVFVGLFASAPTLPGIAAAVLAILSAAVSWWLSERQDRENRSLLAQVDKLEGRTPTERGVSAAFTGQGELATWNYSTLIDRLRDDEHVR